MKTQRRHEASRRQETAVADVLLAAGFMRHVDDLARNQIPAALSSGEFTNEKVVAGKKCDVPVRLHDGRFFAIECKVSNGLKNGWKRLNVEIGGKAELWRREFGSDTLVGAVLARVFDIAALVGAQNLGRYSLLGA